MLRTGGSSDDVGGGKVINCVYDTIMMKKQRNDFTRENRKRGSILLYGYLQRRWNQNSTRNKYSGATTRCFAVSFMQLKRKKESHRWIRFPPEVASDPGLEPGALRLGGARSYPTELIRHLYKNKEEPQSGRVFILTQNPRTCKRFCAKSWFSVPQTVTGVFVLYLSWGSVPLLSAAGRRKMTFVLNAPSTSF